MTRLRMSFMRASNRSHWQHNDNVGFHLKNAATLSNQWGPLQSYPTDSLTAADQSCVCRSAPSARSESGGRQTASVVGRWGGLLQGNRHSPPRPEWKVVEDLGLTRMRVLRTKSVLSSDRQTSLLHTSTDPRASLEVAGCSDHVPICKHAVRR